MWVHLSINERQPSKNAIMTIIGGAAAPPDRRGGGLPGQTAARAASMSRTLCKEAAKNMLSDKSSKPAKREIQTVVELQDRLDQILDLLEFYESC